MKKIAVGMGLVMAVVALATLTKPPLLDNIAFSTVVYDEHHQLLRVVLTPDEKYRVYTPLAQIPKELIQATLLKEDRYFYQHPGVNFSAILRAVWQTYIVHHKRMGGSTISMQVARLQYHLNTHTIAGKIQQIILAIRLEHYYTKQAILEAYFNLAPYGNNIEGAGAASLVYFHRPLNTLSLPEMLLLSVIPQSPATRTSANKNLPKLLVARQQLFNEWRQYYHRNDDMQPLLNLPPGLYSLHNMPFAAPHFVNYILSHPHPREVITTLDVQWQRLIENSVKNYITQKQQLGIHNAAVLVVDSRNLGVKAWVGSADFFNKTIQGEVDGITAKRSPGSTLKPFIYALALDQGLIHPASVLKDAPTSFGAYDPENFDHTFLGPIKATDALVLSRNVPAIYLASLLKQPSLYDFLMAADVPLKPEKNYGLALVLGGAEVSMLKMAQLYAMLSNAGVYHPLRFSTTDKLAAGKKLLSPEASFLTVDMLKNNMPPTAYAPYSNAHIAWKTGTASGFRDATAMGIVGPYVLIVWIGNFDGTPNPAFTGINAAAPLFFNIVGALHQDITDFTARTALPVRNLHLARVNVCSASGLLPTRYCPHTSATWFIPGVSPIKKDTVYREVMLDAHTGLRSCHPNPHNRFAIYEFWSSDLLKIFQQAGMPRRIPPAYMPGCDTIADSTHLAPVITSPLQNTRYVFNTQQIGITLSANTDADVKNIHWFVNQQYLGAKARDALMIWHPDHTGYYVIRAVDDYGQTDARDVHVVGVVAD